MKTRIIIADDHQLFAEGLYHLLSQESNFEFLGFANDGNSLLKKLKGSLADLILLDVNMPGMDGIQAAQKILEFHPSVKLLMVTMSDQPHILKTLIQSGVHGIVLKNTGKIELLLAISEIMAGRTYFSQKVTQQLASDYRVASQDNWQLTRREKEVLQLIFEGLSSSQIAEKLEITAYTVETHRKNLFLKSGLNKSAQLVKRAQELGYLNAG
jgi:DNA-binding NarL/FixJ family response regulator